MFEFLFKYPAYVFQKGTFVLAGSWPRWALVAGILAAAVVLAAVIWTKRRALKPSLIGLRSLVLWGLQSALIALVVWWAL